MKYSYNKEFQDTIIKFVLNSPEGRKAIPLIQGEYFTALEHHIYIRAIKEFWRKHAKIPSKVFMVEELKLLIRDKEFEGHFTYEEQKELLTLDFYFDIVVKHGDLLLKEIAKFASFVELQSLIRDTDLSDYSEYEPLASGVRKAINIPLMLEGEKRGEFLIKDIKDRQFDRVANNVVIPTPFHQINRWTNAGGYSKGSVIVLLDKAKNLKTFSLINVARGYLRMKKRVLYIDMENGKMEIFNRLEQSIGKMNKKDLLSGKRDKDVQKMLRRYRRLGGEVYVEKIPAFSPASAIQDIIDEQYQEHGIIFTDLIIDYVALMGSETKAHDDFKRIGDAFLDIANLGFANNFDHVWTAMHVTREAWKRSETKYRDSDVAKSIDITRHVQAIIGLQRNAEEKEADLLRMEVIVQRDGIPEAKAYFHINPEWQYAQELTKAELEEISVINSKVEAAKEKEGSRRGDQ